MTETEQNEEDKKTGKSISRRGFLQVLGALAGVGGAAAVGYGGRMYHDKQISDQRTSLLQATEVALNSQGKTSSFVEQGSFTNEVFSEARHATAVIEANYVDMGKFGKGTCWAADKTDKSLYFVTNAHVVAAGKDRTPNASDIRFYRPHIDQGPIQSTHTSIRIHPTQDIAVIRVDVPSTVIDTFTVLTYQEGYIPKDGEQVLDVGFPHEFAEGGDTVHMDISGQVSHVQRYDREAKEITINSLDNTQSSGSAIIQTGDGNPARVIGMHSHVLNTEVASIATTLDRITGMIEDLKKD
jgi:hypothetical protein